MINGIKVQDRSCRRSVVSSSVCVCGGGGPEKCPARKPKSWQARRVIFVTGNRSGPLFQESVFAAPRLPLELVPTVANVNFENSVARRGHRKPSTPIDSRACTNLYKITANIFPLCSAELIGQSR
jgi:hypothetical protein